MTDGLSFRSNFKIVIFSSLASSISDERTWMDIRMHLQVVLWCNIMWSSKSFQTYNLSKWCVA